MWCREMTLVLNRHSTLFSWGPSHLPMPKTILAQHTWLVTNHHTGRFASSIINLNTLIISDLVIIIVNKNNIEISPRWNFRNIWTQISGSKKSPISLVHQPSIAPVAAPQTAKGHHRPAAWRRQRKRVFRQGAAGARMLGQWMRPFLRAFQNHPYFDGWYIYHEILMVCISIYGKWWIVYYSIAWLRTYVESRWFEHCFSVMHRYIRYHQTSQPLFNRYWNVQKPAMLHWIWLNESPCGPLSGYPIYLTRDYIWIFNNVSKALS